MNNTIKSSYYQAVSLCKAYIPFAFLSLIPTMLSKPETALESIASYGVNLLFVTVLFCLGIIKAKRKTLYYNKNYCENITYKAGLLEKRLAVFKKGCVKSLVIEKHLLPLLFFSEKVILSTGSPTGKNGNFSMFILKKHENRLISCFFTEKNSFKTVYKANLLKIFFMALSSSNAFAGIIIFIPFLNKTGELFGEKYKNIIFSSLDFSSHIQQTGIPPFAAGIAGLLLTGLVISVIAVMFSYGFLTIQKTSEKDIVLIKRGVIQKNIFITSSKKIIAYQIKKSLMMSLLKRCNLKIYACGQHREKGNKKVIVPFLSVKKGDAFLNLNPFDKAFIARPPVFSQKAYLYLPLTLMTLLWASCIFALFLNYDFTAFYPLIIFLFLLLFAFFTMRIFAHKKAFIYADKNKCVVSSYKRLSFIKTLIPISKIQAIQINQSIFQRYRNLCTLCVYIYGEKKRCFKIKHLKLSKGIEYSSFVKAIQQNKN